MPERAINLVFVWSAFGGIALKPGGCKGHVCGLQAMGNGEKEAAFKWVRSMKWRMGGGKGFLGPDNHLVIYIISIIDITNEKTLGIMANGNVHSLRVQDELLIYFDITLLVLYDLKLTPTNFPLHIYLYKYKVCISK